VRNEAEGTPELLSFLAMKIVSQNSRSSVWNLLALFTIVFWGTSFVSTKVLLGYDFSAVQIFTFRFLNR
jgi:hypothetical protein